MKASEYQAPVSYNQEMLNFIKWSSHNFAFNIKRID